MKNLVAIAFILWVFVCPAVPSVLSDKAASLSPGQHTDVTEMENPYSNGYDIQWMTVCAFYDTLHKEIQYMGKFASGQDPSGKFHHYVYDEASNTWQKPLQGPLIGSGTTGHIWNAAFDFATGDYYIQPYNLEFLCKFDRAAWVSAGKPDGASGAVPSYWSFRTATADILYSTETNLNGMAVHPNLFGPGDKGIAVAGCVYIWGYRMATNTWDTLSSNFYRTEVRGGATGGAGWYIASADVAVVGGSDGVGGHNPMWQVPAGSGGTHPANADYGDPTPIRISGSSGTGCGKQIIDPNNWDRLLILEVGGASRVWASEDQGQSWTLQGFTHPLGDLNDTWNSWTACSITGYGVIIGLRSSGGFLARMWKVPTQGTDKEARGPARNRDLEILSIGFDRN